MPASLLDSQFATLEEPADAIAVSVEGTPDQIVAEIVKKLGATS
jgi:gluconokinase